MFTTRYPRDVDFSIMLTFLEFYETLLKFAMFKLFHTLDLRYDPNIINTLAGCKRRAGDYFAILWGFQVLSVFVLPRAPLRPLGGGFGFEMSGDYCFVCVANTPVRMYSLWKKCSGFFVVTSHPIRWLLPGSIV